MSENPPAQQQSVYSQVGDSGFVRLVAGFYRRVAVDPVLRPLYVEADLSAAEVRLRLFLIQFFGGPTTYSQQRGHPRLRMRHAPFTIGQTERDAWVRAMLGALDESQIAEPAYSTMREYFEQAADFLMNASPSGGMLHPK